jgi:hypothetical protein
MRPDTSHSTSSSAHRRPWPHRSVIRPITWPIRRFDIAVARYGFDTKPNEHFTQS